LHRRQGLFDLFSPTAVQRDTRPVVEAGRAASADYQRCEHSYVAIADATASINTTSSSKTNFWNYVQVLFHANPAPNDGLAGYKVQSKTPAPMTYNSTSGYWEAVGIPTLNYDDSGKFNPYPMAKLVARNSTGTVLATASVVLAVSDEMSCKNCHASGSDSAAQPSTGWVNNANPSKDTKLNILKKHDDRWNIASYLPQLKSKGYTYQTTLYETAVGGTPVLCAACHSDNALGAPGLPGIGAEASDMHKLHGPQILQSNGLTLDQNSKQNDFNSCYLCHPGPVTQCKRGAMNKVLCSNCHGTVTYAGNPSRNPWLVEPSCQLCHQNSQRSTTAFDTGGLWRTVTDQTFATNQNVPIAGSDLYRYSSGHGKMYCSACHGSPHSEYPTLQVNDSVYPMQEQGYVAKITECSVCHTSVPVTPNGGPHGVHTLGQSWVTAHHDYAQNHLASCAYCHGSNYRGTALSVSKVARTFNVDDGRTKTFSAGHQFSCYDCHNGPNGG
jgi:decaheme cytochrome c component MtrC/MtrF-like protein